MGIKMITLATVLWSCQRRRRTIEPAHEPLNHLKKDIVTDPPSPASLLSTAISNVKANVGFIACISVVVIMGINSLLQEVENWKRWLPIISICAVITMMERVNSPTLQILQNREQIDRLLPNISAVENTIESLEKRLDADIDTKRSNRRRLIVLDQLDEQRELPRHGAMLARNGRPVHSAELNDAEKCALDSRSRKSRKVRFGRLNWGLLALLLFTYLDSFIQGAAQIWIEGDEEVALQGSAQIWSEGDKEVILGYSVVMVHQDHPVSLCCAPPLPRPLRRSPSGYDMDYETVPDITGSGTGYKISRQHDSSPFNFDTRLATQSGIILEL